MKRAWERLEKVPIRGEYSTDVHRWTCDCGSQKYHAHLLCKHLVQAVGHPSADWWPTVTRYHIPPFYTVPLNGEIAEAPEAMRSHDWTGRMRAKRSAIVSRPPHRFQTPDPDRSDVDIPEFADRTRSSPPVQELPLDLLACY